MKRSPREMLDSAEFKRLVSRRWAVSIVLTLALFLMYYGYILLIAWNKPLLARKLGEATTLGIPAGVGVIIVSWILTAIYVVWANRRYDVEVRRLKEQVGE
jgi:uncharacterized membrane protein (DUF485 family)